MATLPVLWIPALHAGMTARRRFVCTGMPMTLVAHFRVNSRGARREAIYRDGGYRADWLASLACG